MDWDSTLWKVIWLDILGTHASTSYVYLISGRRIFSVSTGIFIFLRFSFHVIFTRFNVLLIRSDFCLILSACKRRLPFRAAIAFR